MKHLGKRRLKLLLVIAAIVSILAFLVIPRMGTYLAYQEDLQSADAMVVLMGSTADRVLGAYDLYEAGFATRVILVDSRQRGGRHARERGIHIPNNTDITVYALSQLDVPTDSVLVLPGEATSTRDEARIVRQYLEAQPDIRSIMLVSSPPHLRRARLTFKKELRQLEQEIIIITSASAYSDFQARGWYRDRESAKSVVLEYLKLVAWRLGF